MLKQAVKLTALSHGGGCGCKIAPATLAKLLDGIRADAEENNLLVDSSTKDDAAVFALNDTCALVATTDFFTPIVDDPQDFGRIAAANAISDIYAMGAKPLFALNIVGMPVDKLSPDIIVDILKGGRQMCAQASILIAGGHSIDSLEPIYGLAVVGEVHPAQVKRNADAKLGDVLILSKPIGIGVIATAIKRDLASDKAYEQMLHWATLLNVTGEKLSTLKDVHAMTDVTGYGLLGHLLEVCQASNVGAVLQRQRIPVIESARELLVQGVMSVAANRNYNSYGQQVDFGDSIEEYEKNLLCDPQTNGGLLVACAPHCVDEVLDAFHHDGCTEACVIGEIKSTAGIRLSSK